MFDSCAFTDGPGLSDIILPRESILHIDFEDLEVLLSPYRYDLEVHSLAPGESADDVRTGYAIALAAIRLMDRYQDLPPSEPKNDTDVLEEQYKRDAINLASTPKVDDLVVGMGAYHRGRQERG